MSLTGTLFLLFGVLIVFSVPVSIALGLASIITISIFMDVPMMVVIQRVYQGADSFSLMAIPFFILAGNIMSSGGVSKRLVDVAEGFFGRMKGGLALVATGASVFFGAISGSAPATTAAIGSIMVPQMEDKGYDKEFAAATVASSGTIGLLIPPSITMILYGVVANVSIGKLFLGGIIPGILMAIALGVVEVLIARKRNYVSNVPINMREILARIKKAILALLMPVIILGGIYGGIFTPTEAAVVAVVYGFIIAIFVYRQLDFTGFKKVLLSSAKSSSVIMYLVATASVFSYILSSEKIPQKISAVILGISTEPLIVLLLIAVMLLIVGTFLDNAVAMVLLTPVFAPAIAKLGIDPVFFGVFMVLALAIGQITPPVGLCLFVACDVAKVSIEQLSRNVVFPVIALLIVLLIVMLFPFLVTVIPNAVL
jgi:C4-dicarboxylate transporter DctM subunit